MGMLLSGMEEHQMSITLENPEVQHADRADLISSIRSVEHRTGHSFAELREFAASDTFPDVRTQIAWQAVSRLGDLVG